MSASQANIADLARLEGKVEQFMLAQDKHNETVVKNLEKLTGTISTQQAQQVEINQLNSINISLNAKVDRFGSRIGALESNQAIAKEFRKEMTQLKWVCISAAFSLVVGIAITIIKTLT